MNARVLLLSAPCAVLLSCEAKKEPAPPPPPPPGTPVVTAQDGGAATTAPAAPLPQLAADPGGATGAPRWGLALGGLGSDAPRGIAVDAAGASYLAGYFEAEMTFGKLGTRAPAPPDTSKLAANAKPPLPRSDAFVVRIDAAGAPTWVQTFGASREDVANGVAVDAKGNLAVTGNFLDALTIGSGTDALSAKAAGSDDVFVAAFTPDGTPTWLWTSGGIDSDGGNAIAAHPDGGWVVAGSFSASAELGPQRFKSQGATDAFLVKLAPGGEVQWALQLGGRYADTILGAATDPAGSIYVLGQFSDTASVGGAPLVAAGNAGVDVFLAKYDAGGKHLWSTRFGNELDDGARGLAVDPAGNVTVTGSFEKTIQIGTETFQSHGETDIYVARFGTDGAFRWARAWGSKRDDVGHAVAADAAGNAIVTGWFQDTVDIGGASVTSKGNKDVLIAKLDAKGATVWARAYGDRDHDQGRAIAVDGKGEPTVAGVFRFTLDAVKPPLESVHAAGDKAPRSDVFVLHLDR
jgi:hypothetical protein